MSVHGCHLCTTTPTSVPPDPQNDSAVQPQQFKSSLRIRFDPIMPASSYQIEGQGGNTSIGSGTMEGSNTSPNESGTGAEVSV